MKARIATVAAFLLVLVFCLGYGTAGGFDRQPTLSQRVAELEKRVRELEIHDCGLRQFEDYSVMFQRDDDVRFRCADALGR